MVVGQIHLLKATDQVGEWYSVLEKVAILAFPSSQIVYSARKGVSNTYEICNTTPKISHLCRPLPTCILEQVFVPSTPFEHPLASARYRARRFIGIVSFSPHS